MTPHSLWPRGHRLVKSFGETRPWTVWTWRCAPAPSTACSGPRRRQDDDHSHAGDLIRPEPGSARSLDTTSWRRPTPFASCGLTRPARLVDEDLTGRRT